MSAAKCDNKELKKFVRLKVIKKESESSEHIPLHPFWLSSPIDGLKEELDKYLGKWRPHLGAYLLAYEDVRIDKSSGNSGMIYIDQPWIHYDVEATFYTYTPHVDQILRGVVTERGDTAAICTFFKCFSVTVHPDDSNLTEFEKWVFGTELEFKVTSFTNRQKGPLIEAVCTRVLKHAVNQNETTMEFDNHYN